MKVRIKEASPFARIAARKMRSSNVALVLGGTVHLWGVSRREFLSAGWWVRHELEHIRQFKRYGYVRFAAMYLWEWMRRGYYNNQYEKEARAAEGVDVDLSGIEFV